MCYECYEVSRYAPKVFGWSNRDLASEGFGHFVDNVQRFHLFPEPVIYDGK